MQLYWIGQFFIAIIFRRLMITSRSAKYSTTIGAIVYDV